MILFLSLRENTGFVQFGKILQWIFCCHLKNSRQHVNSVEKGVGLYKASLYLHGCVDPKM